MEDVTDTVFRRMVAACGRPHVFFTEFVCADGLFSAGRDAVIHRLRYTPEEKPLIAQVWGNSPENYCSAARLLNEMGYDGIDINMGCPVPKIIKHGCYAALIENRTLAAELIQAAKEGASGMPVSVKTRLGFRTRVTEEWIGFLLEQKPAALTVHGRLAKDMSRFPADWGEIAKAVRLRNAMRSETVIIGNGDAADLQDLHRKANESDVDGVMVGRGIFQNLFFFSGRDPAEATASQRLALLLQHARLYVATWGETRDFAAIKKYFKIYAAHFRGAPALRAELMQAQNLTELEMLAAGWLARWGGNSPLELEVEEAGSARADG